MAIATMPMVQASVEVDSAHSLKEMVREFEKTLITECLRRNHGCKFWTAIELGLSRPGLDKKLKRCNIENHHSVTRKVGSAAERVRRH